MNSLRENKQNFQIVPWNGLSRNERRLEEVVGINFSSIASVFLTVCCRSRTEAAEIAVTTPRGVIIATCDAILDQSERTPQTRVV